MLLVLFVGLLIAGPSCVQRRVTLVVIVGTIHQPSRNFNPNSVAQMLARIQPDLILVELDSTFFTPAFELKKAPRENEGLGIVQYRREHRQVPMRPFDYEGRNDFHRRHGILTKPAAVMALLDQLYKRRRLTVEQGTVLDTYYALTDSLAVVSHQSAYAINQPVVNRMVERRQRYQYQRLNAVVQARPELADYHVTTSCRVLGRPQPRHGRSYSRLCAAAESPAHRGADRLLSQVLFASGAKAAASPRWV